MAGAASGSQALVINDASRAAALEDLKSNMELAVDEALNRSQAPDFKSAWEALPEQLRNDVEFCTSVILEAPGMVQFFSKSVLENDLLKEIAQQYRVGR